MHHSQPIRWLVVSLIGLLALFALAGCGGGTTSGSGVDIRYPDGDPSKTGTIAGTVSSLVGGQIDFPQNATVSLERLTGAGYVAANDVPAVQTTTTGSYQFPAVPAGTYRVTATVAPQPPYLEETLRNSVEGIVVVGGRPTLLVDIMVGKSAEMVTFTGLVSKGGTKVAGATVCLSIMATNKNDEIVIATTTDQDGRYELPVPNSAISYIISAYGNNSGVYVSTEIVSISGTEMQHDIQLPSTVNGFITPTIFVKAITLPTATPSGYEDTAIAKLAIARAAHADPSRIAALEAQATTKGVTRSLTFGGLLENEVIALSDNYDIQDTYGYKVFRATQQIGPYDYIGSTRDGSQILFTDNDPTLSFGVPAWYTLAAYTANGVMSKPAVPEQATPMKVITVTGDGNTDGTSEVVNGSATLSWEPVDGALAYVVLVYTTPPSLNATQAPQSPYVMTSAHTSLTIMDKGTFWWSVAAYNKNMDSNDPGDLSFTVYATAESHSAFRKVTVQ